MEVKHARYQKNQKQPKRGRRTFEKKESRAEPG